MDKKPERHAHRLQTTIPASEGMVAEDAGRFLELIPQRAPDTARRVRARMRPAANHDATRTADDPDQHQARLYPRSVPSALTLIFRSRAGIVFKLIDVRLCNRAPYLARETDLWRRASYLR